MAGSVSPVIPSAEDSALAVAAVQSLGSGAVASAGVRLRFDGGGADIVIPHTAITALAQVLSAFASGEGVTVLPTHAELTTQQAADVLGVSRPFVIGLLDQGEIEYRKVGSHRRVLASSLVRYLRADDEKRRAAADALSAETYDLGFA